MNNNAAFENYFTIKRNDTLPTLIVKLKTRGSLGEILPLSLTGVTSTTFSMASECGDLTISSQTAQVIDSECGVIQYSWQNGDTSEAGKYDGEFELNFSGGTKLTVPIIGSIKIQILKDINNN